MKPPPFLLSATLLFWGWQTGFLLVAVPLALILESARWIEARWEFTEQDFSRIWTFCSLLLLATAVYSFNSNHGLDEVVGVFRNGIYNPRNRGIASARTAAAVIRWMPMLFFPCIAAQYFSASQSVPLQAISHLVRRRWRNARKLGLTLPQRNVDLSYPYFLVCLFAASMHSGEDASFFFGISALAAWALWPVRAPRFAAATWIVVLGLTIGLSYFGQSGFTRLQRYLDHISFSGFGRGGFDPHQTKTALGQIGRLKASSTIVIRVDPRKTKAPPSLLREAVYSTYRPEAATWLLGRTNGEWTIVTEQTNRGNWVLITGKTNSLSVNIACYLDGGYALLPLPEGTGRAEHLPIYVLDRTSAGAVRAKGPNLVIFDALYGPGELMDAEPNPAEDFEVPPREKAALEKIVPELHLTSKDLESSLRAVNRYFITNFNYSVWQEPPRVRHPSETPLGRFLLQTHAGHCEYFATATVLLLRELGFPARYAVGYAVHEPSGRKYVVRQRDAHAWCMVWDEDRQTWRDFDTTPASWLKTEAAHGGKFQWLSDAWSRIRFELAKIRWGQSHLRQYIILALVPILALLLYQIVFRTKRERQRRTPSSSTLEAVRPGLDSEFYQLERSLAQWLPPRQPGEALSGWLTHASKEPQLAAIKPRLDDLLRLHYSYRFDPQGLSPGGRETLRHQARTCIAHLGRKN